MTCPFCGGEMEKGHILGDRYELKWMPEDKPLFLGLWAKDALVFKNQREFHVDRPKVESFVCHTCKKLIADL